MSQDPNDVTRQKSPQSKSWRSRLTHQDFSCVTYQDFSCMTNQDFRSPGGRVSKSVTWCFTPSQPWQLYIRMKGGREGDGNVIQVCTALLPTCVFYYFLSWCCLLLLVFVFVCLIQNTVQQPTLSCSVPYLWTALRRSISHQFGMHLNALGSIIACARLPSSDALIWPVKKKEKKRPIINN